METIKWAVNKMPKTEDSNLPVMGLDEVRKARTAGIYTDDEKCVIRMSHLNPQVQKLYADYLDKPLSEKAHHLLHNHYHAKKIYAK